MITGINTLKEKIARIFRKKYLHDDYLRVCSSEHEKAKYNFKGILSNVADVFLIFINYDIFIVMYNLDDLFYVNLTKTKDSQILNGTNRKILFSLLFPSNLCRSLHYRQTNY